MPRMTTALSTATAALGVACAVVVQAQSDVSAGLLQFRTGGRDERCGATTLPSTKSRGEWGPLNLGSDGQRAAPSESAFRSSARVPDRIPAIPIFPS